MCPPTSYRHSLTTDRGLFCPPLRRDNEVTYLQVIVSRAVYWDLEQSLHHRRFGAFRIIIPVCSQQIVARFSQTLTISRKYF